MVANLVRKDKETLNVLPKRLDKANGKFYDGEEVGDGASFEF